MATTARTRPMRTHRRWGPLAVKLCALAAGIGALGFTLFIHNAASAVEDARGQTMLSGEVTPQTLAPRYRELALERMRRAWSRPLDWHAEARETAGWAHALEAAQGERRLDAMLSYAWTERAVQGAPVHPQGWLRLAALHDAAPRPACTARECLERSWATAPMGVLSRDFLCERMQLGVRSGLVTRADDLRVRLLLYERWSPRDLDRCLEGLPEAEIEAAKARNAQR